MEKKRRTQGWVLLATQIDRFIENFHPSFTFSFFLEDINLFTKMSRLNEYLIKPKEKSEMIRGAELD
ncbi:hypothetical protein QR98_0053520 [Sarcoptes scabiei]|uniref:Uncharacterized protein n=1 Tax=Sarcoptes scabiei TaxID=52283 RepID=A0A132A7E5_SARSC|nr:hypothetical protein QR98_0053520 [Sarcoptes scabiei]